MVFKNLLFYNTGKKVVILSKRLRLLQLFFQLGVLAYLLWVIIYNRGYQNEESGIGTSISKLTDVSSYSMNDTLIVWDQPNIEFPFTERDAIFITTNYITTPNQTRSNSCTDTSVLCNTTNCEYLQPVKDGNNVIGLATGNCTEDGLCLLYAWCPVQKSQNATLSTALQNVQEFSIQLQTVAYWNNWDIQKSNSKNSATKNYNLFYVSDIVSGSGYDLQDMLVSGGAIGFVVTWDCNFDKAKEHCEPSFDFIRVLMKRKIFTIKLDDPDSSLSSGYNFYFTNEYRYGSNAIVARDLYKVYGIRIIFLHHVIGRKFAPVVLILNIASAIGILFLSNYISDMVSMWLLPHSPQYRNKKYMNVDEQEKEQKRQRWHGILSAEQLNKAFF